MTLSLDQPELNLNDCGCCAGIAVETPMAIDNRPGLTAIAYRIGTHAKFKTSMLARLSESGLSELRKLMTRDDDDFTIALLDAWAVTADVLTFYQERIANESYLRTATERRSIIDLARLIGYELRPGVAASTYLAFTLESAAGAPGAVTIDEGLRVQSIPGPDEKPQSFETVEQIDARAEFNAMRPRQTELHNPVFGDRFTFLSGVTTNLKPGDPLLIVGAERESNKNNDNWEIRSVAAVEPDAPNQRTLVRWSEPLGSKIPFSDSPKQGTKVYALRLHASIFGFNAPAWKTLPVALRVGEVAPVAPVAAGSAITSKFEPGAFVGRDTSWADKRFLDATTIINLDAVYSQVTLNSWIVLVKPQSKSDDLASTFPPYKELYKVGGVGEETKVDFNMSAKTTLLKISGENIEKFAPRDTTVFAQSDLLELAETPLTDPVWKNEIVLEGVVDGLEEGRELIVTGKRMRAIIGTTRANQSLTSLDGSEEVALAAGDSLIVTAAPTVTEEEPNQTTWRLVDKTGFEGFITAADDKITLAPAAASDVLVSEVVQLQQAVLSADAEHTILKLIRPQLSAFALQNVYDRVTVTIAGNVALSTHGETVKDEVLGSGNAGQPYQRFTLRQSPLTYTSADNPSGGESTLELRVNDLEWTEVPTLFGHGPRERIYVTHIDDDQTAKVQFGDGITGARLPIGNENVKATYRKGIGISGLMAPGQLSLLMTRPLGVKSVLNPLAASGAQDPQVLADARANSPLTVLTLDRIVSLRDYEDFARTFSGIAKALATWTWNIHTRGVFITVAGIDGAEVADDAPLHGNLVSAILQSGDPHVPITIKSYRGVTFKLLADVKIDSQYIEANVLAAIETALRTSFSFAARGFGQPVTLSEVFAVMQNVAGVVAVDINKLYRTGATETLNSFLAAAAPRAGDDAGVLSAELLTLDAAPLELGVMP
ncbi:MAG: putative baseplate assembly protein [Pyrinomonadaceae bacterium]|nr:putative baseplate assembly protein [Pyrinomonadaceae bacterium]